MRLRRLSLGIAIALTTAGLLLILRSPGAVGAAADRWSAAPALVAGGPQSGTPGETGRTVGGLLLGVGLLGLVRMHGRPL